MIRCKIDVTKIDKTLLFKGQKGTYLDIVLIEQHGDRFGNDFLIIQDVGKLARERGEKGAILGNGKLFFKQHVPTKSEPSSNQPAPQENPDEDVPF